MYEVILIILAVSALILPKIFLQSLKEPYRLYLRITFGVVLLTFAWLYETSAPHTPKFLMTIAVIYGFVDNYKDFKMNRISIPK